MTTREAVIKEARSWLGTPYHHQARVRGAGVDCAQLVIEVFHACGLAPRVEPGAYSSQWHLHRGEELYLQWMQRHARPTSEPMPGDVGLWRFGHAYSHAAILVADTEVVHALAASRAVVVSHLHERPLKGRAVRWFTVFQEGS